MKKLLFVLILGFVHEQANAQCTANFAINDILITTPEDTLYLCSPFKVTFSNKTSGGQSTRLWDFGTKKSSSNTVSFLASKNVDTVYTIKLTSTCLPTGTSTKSATVKVIQTVPKPFIISNSNSMCDVDSVILKTNSTLQCIWKKDTVSVGTGNSLKLEDGGSYTVETKDENGYCTAKSDPFIVNPIPTWFLDIDKDGLGDPFTTNTSCMQPIGYVSVCDNGVVSTFAGSGVAGNSDGTSLNATLYYPIGIVFDKLGNIYVADAGNNKIRKITRYGNVSTFAGSGISGSTDGTSLNATFKLLKGITFDSIGNIYVLDEYRIRKITPNGVVSTFASFGISGSTGVTTSYSTQGITVDNIGNIYVTEYNRIRKITPNGVVIIFAGSLVSGSIDGRLATFNSPQGIATDKLGNIYVADAGNNKIRKITRYGNVSTFAGSGISGSTDGTSLNATFNFPQGITVDSIGNIYVTEHNKIRKITPNGDVSTIAGSGVAGSIDGRLATFNNPQGIATDKLGNIYVADAGNNKIRRISNCSNIIMGVDNIYQRHSVSMFPNPAHDILNINFDKLIGNYTINIVNSTGITVYSKSLNQPLTQLNIGDYVKGIYFIKIQDLSNNILETKKLMIE